MLADAVALSVEERAILITAVQPREQQPKVSPLPADQVPSQASIRTFLIADLRGYTSLTEGEGDEAAARLTSRFGALVRDCVAPHAGELVDTRGDEVLVAVTSARQALRAAIRLDLTRCGGTPRLGLVQHHARFFRGPLTRTVAMLLAHPVRRLTHIEST